MYKHVSVDFWHTLGTPSKTYGGLRDAILGEAYGVPASVARAGYKQLKDTWEQLAVETGLVPPLAMLRLQMNQLWERELPVTEFYAVLERLRVAFAAHPPHVCQESLAELRRVRELGFTLSVGSNTNFMMRGAEIQALLPGGLFLFQIYSDEVGWCKPHRRFFQKVDYTLGNRRILDTPRKEEVLHVGDNPTCDVSAAQDYGFHAQLCSEERPLHQILKEFDRAYC